MTRAPDPPARRSLAASAPPGRGAGKGAVRLRRAIVVAGVVVAVLVVLWATGGDGGSEARGPGPTWTDEFDGAAGTRPAKHWRLLEGGGGWGNNELQIYTSRAENVSLDGRGNLRI